MYTQKMEGRTIFKLVLLSNILHCSIQWSVDDSGCRTPDKEVGDCIIIQSCSTMMNFLSKTNIQSLDENSKKYIRSFMCGTGTAGLKVCCPRIPIDLNHVISRSLSTNETSRYSSSRSEPKQCKTATQDEGTCIGLQSCNPVTNLISEIKNSFTKQRQNVMKLYWCSNIEAKPSTVNCQQHLRFLTAINETERDEINNVLNLYQCGEDSEESMVCCPEQTPDPAFHENLKLLPSNDCIVNEVVDPNLDWIYGGSLADLFEFPWMVALKYSVKNKAVGGTAGEEEDFRCGAALINKRYLLTAAHCIQTKKISLIGAKLGEIDLNNTNSSKVHKHASEPKDFEITTQDAIVHPYYNPSSMINDIALIRLREDVPSSVSISPICLPIRLKSRSNKLKGKVTVTGWGETETGTRSMKLLKIDVPVITSEDCSTYYTNVINITNQQLCAGGKDATDTCRGDSGGPLMSKMNLELGTKTILYGIVSLGPTRCAKENFPAVYTRVTSYLNWILDNMKP